jgi:hypothetical protein
LASLKATTFGGSCPKGVLKAAQHFLPAALDPAEKAKPLTRLLSKLGQVPQLDQPVHRPIQALVFSHAQLDDRFGCAP